MKSEENYIILNWMDGGRTYFKTSISARKEFKKLKKEYLKEGAEFDMSCFKILEEFNNVNK